MLLFHSCDGLQYHLVYVIRFQIYGPLQELQLLASLCECFSSASEKHKYRLFRLLFLKSEDTVNPLLNKMVSMALSVSCASILDCTAIWMQVLFALHESLALFHRAYIAC